MDSSQNDQYAVPACRHDPSISVQNVASPIYSSSPSTPVLRPPTPNGFGGPAFINVQVNVAFSGSPDFANSFAYNHSQANNGGGSFMESPAAPIYMETPTSEESPRTILSSSNLDSEPNSAPTADQSASISAAVHNEEQHGEKFDLSDKSALGHLGNGINHISSMPWSSVDLKTQASGATAVLCENSNAAVENSSNTISSANTVLASEENSSINAYDRNASPMASENRVFQGPVALPPYPPFATGSMGRSPLIQPPSAFRNMASNAPVISQNTQIRPFAPQPISSFPSFSIMPPQYQASWPHPPQMVGFQRPSFSYSGVLPGPRPTAMHLLPVPAMTSTESQPPGVSAVENAKNAIPNVFLPDQTTQLEAPDNMDMHKNEAVDVWTAHKTETGVCYYYNSLTGVSSYEKPIGFKAEADKVTAQSTPTSWEKLAGTDWMLVTTTDAKKYYYNTKTKISSWQIPPEVIEFRQKQDNETGKIDPGVSESTLLNSKGPNPLNLSAPAVATGGRDSVSLRLVGGTPTSSALDLVKKKLHDAGTIPIPSPLSQPSHLTSADLNDAKSGEVLEKVSHSENSKEKLKESNRDDNLSDSSSDSDDINSGPSTEECVIKFKEMLKERGVAPFSKWDRELPKIVFDPRFKAVPDQSTRRAIFEHYVRTRAEEERKEKRAAQKAAVEGFKKLLEDDASQDIDEKTDYESFKRKWGKDPRFQALDRKERVLLLNEKVLFLKKTAEKNMQAMQAAATSGFTSMLRERQDITINSRWSRIKESLRDDPRYTRVKHEDREKLFNEFIAELKVVEEAGRISIDSKNDEQMKLKEREREMRKRKEREEQEMERVRLKARRKNAIVSYQSLLVEKIKDPQASWTESKIKLEKDPLERAANIDLDKADLEKLFREHVNMLNERAALDYKTLLSEVLTAEAATHARDDGKTALTSWSVAKEQLKSDSRFSKMPRKERESLWRRYADDMLRKLKPADEKEENKNKESRSRRTPVREPVRKSSPARDRNYSSRR